MTFAQDKLIAHAVLVDAGERVMFGWCQGRFRRGNCVCATEALYSSAARYGKKAHIKAAHALVRVLGTASLVTWNDNGARTQEEVVNAFAEAADLALRN